MKLYYVMMVMIGMTIGAIAGLSSTSVTNTLLQLVAPVAAGSVGLYFIDRKTQREVDALSRIGLLGVLFVAAAWGAYAVAVNYRYDTAHYDWDHETKSLYDNIALAELYGHARNLGIADADLQTALVKHRREVAPANLLSTRNTQPCELLREDAKVVGNVVSAAYDAVEKRAGLDARLKLNAEAIRVRFSAMSNRLNDDAPDSSFVRERMREQAVASLLLLTVNDGRLAKPAEAANCASSPDDLCEAARRMQRMLETCTDIGLVDALATLRAHAGAFSSVWRQAASTKPPKGKYVLESASVLINR